LVSALCGVSQSINTADLPLELNMGLSEQQSLKRITQLFDRLFFDSHKTRLLGGAREPLYLPATTADQPHRLLYRENYLSSALHEIAHWCIAGAERLQKQDYGYWYQPDGRSALQQRQFEAVEIKPQALEWLFSIACGQKFRLSVDNLAASGAMGANQGFKCAVTDQAIIWCQNTELPPRGKRFIDGLATAFAIPNPYDLRYYQLDFLN